MNKERDLDDRCCGSDACIINDQGVCWCGQIWDGEKMVFPKLKPLPTNLDEKG
jgi:hypothetical protein